MLAASEIEVCFARHKRPMINPRRDAKLIGRAPGHATKIAEGLGPATAFMSHLRLGLWMNHQSEKCAVYKSRSIHLMGSPSPTDAVHSPIDNVSVYTDFIKIVMHAQQ